MDENEAYLKSLDETHNPASVEDDGFTKLPDGEYRGRLDRLYFSRSKKERMQCVWEFEIISGAQAFRKVMKFSGMDTAMGLDFLTRDLRRVGIDKFKWSNVQTQFDKPLDKLFLLRLETKVKKGQSFQSVFIVRALKEDEVMVSKPLRIDDDDDVPF